MNCFCLHKMSNIFPLKICMHSFMIYVAWNLSSFFFSLLTLSVSYLTRCCLPNVCMLGARVSCYQLILRNFHFKQLCPLTIAACSQLMGMNRRLLSTTTYCNAWVGHITSEFLKHHPLLCSYPKKL